MGTPEQAEETASANYVFSKQAIDVYVQRQAVPLCHRGIRINATGPGPTVTPLMDSTPHTWHTFGDLLFKAAMQRDPQTPEEQAPPLVFLNSPAADGRVSGRVRSSTSTCRLQRRRSDGRARHTGGRLARHRLTVQPRRRPLVEADPESWQYVRRSADHVRAPLREGHGTVHVQQLGHVVLKVRGHRPVGALLHGGARADGRGARLDAPPMIFFTPRQPSRLRDHRGRGRRARLGPEQPGSVPRPRSRSAQSTDELRQAQGAPRSAVACRSR